MRRIWIQLKKEARALQSAWRVWQLDRCGQWIPELVEPEPLQNIRECRQAAQAEGPRQLSAINTVAPRRRGPFLASVVKQMNRPAMRQHIETVFANATTSDELHGVLDRLDREVTPLMSQVSATEFVKGVQVACAAVMYGAVLQSIGTDSLERQRLTETTPTDTAGEWIH